MPNGGNTSEGRYREWDEVFIPYENDVNEFAREKGLTIDKWYHDSPNWMIKRTQRANDLNVVWWNIQFGYSEKDKKLGLSTSAWLDREYSVPEGNVRERRLAPRGKGVVWDVAYRMPIKELLEQAYQIAQTFTEQDLTMVSASITGRDGITRGYNPSIREILTQGNEP